MNGYKFLDSKGTFQLDNPEENSYSYFPLANEAGCMSSITPSLNGDCKMGKNTFLLTPVSSEDLHNNKSSRNFWLYIEGKGAWSAAGVSPAQQARLFQDTKEETQLTAGIMWHRITRKSEDFCVRSETTSFVPASSDKVELMKIAITNTGESSIKIRPTAAIPLYGRSADNLRDHRHVTSLLHRIITTENGVILNPTLTFDERGHKKNTVFYGVVGADESGEKPVGYFPITEDFIGEGGSFEVPKAIMLNEVPSTLAGTHIEGYEALGGLSFKEITLKPQETKSYIIGVGFGSSLSDFEKINENYLKASRFETSLQQTKEYWDKKINIAYHTGDEQFDNWMYWVNFQPMLRRIYGCSFLPHHDYGKGGRGWRDLWQDCLALLAMDPQGVREMLLDNFGGVRIDGTNATIIGTKQGKFIADRNNITRVWMDHGAWPFLTTHFYIQQSGDLAFLLEEQVYFKDLQVLRGTDKDELWTLRDGNQLCTENGEVYKGTILEHLLLQHLAAFYDVGVHNNIRLHGADWNDGLDMAEEQGESVAFTALYAGNLQEIAKLLKGLKDKHKTEKVVLIEELQILLQEDERLYADVSKKNQILNIYCKKVRHTVKGNKIEIDIDDLILNLEAKAHQIIEHIRNNEWLSSKEGYHWYNGYYDNHAQRVEGDHALGIRMMLTSQVFTIMNHIATDEQTADIIKAADHYLYDEAVGGYKLNTNFNEVKTDLGRMFGFAYGHKENGAVFCHMAIMYANALYQRNFVKEGFKVINTLYTHCLDFEKSRIYPGVPEYINGKGRGMYHYLTGTASWLMLTVVTEMFGVKGTLGDLSLKPKLLLNQFDEDNRASIEVVFAGRELVIEYINKNLKEHDAYCIKQILIGEAPYIFKEGSPVIERQVLEKLEVTKKHLITVILE